MPHALQYSRPIVGRDTNAVDADLLPLAIYCALAPLCLLIPTFLLWLPTRWLFLEFFGLWTILLGLIMFIVGGVCLFAYLTTELIAGREAPRRIFVRFALCSALLIFNVPLCLLILLAARALGT